jgi:hypothetical protein
MNTLNTKRIIATSVSGNTRIARIIASEKVSTGWNIGVVVWFSLEVH